MKNDSEKKFTYDEFIHFALEHYREGGDTFYEGVSRTEWDGRPEYYGAMTKSRALELFEIEKEIELDMEGFICGGDVE